MQNAILKGDSLGGKALEDPGKVVDELEGVPNVCDSDGGLVGSLANEQPSDHSHRQDRTHGVLERHHFPMRNKMTSERAEGTAHTEWPVVISQLERKSSMWSLEPRLPPTVAFLGKWRTMRRSGWADQERRMEIPNRCNTSVDALVVSGRSLWSLITVSQ